jgi:imidazolonepropionase-like amidohydrolase
MGTDAGGFPWTMNQAGELRLMVNAGMTPMQAIKAATIVAADLLDQEDHLGTIEPASLPTSSPCRVTRCRTLR